MRVDGVLRIPALFVGEDKATKGLPGVITLLGDAGFSDVEEAGRVAFTWGQIMVALKHYVETGTSNPVFA